jgi:hypothetical protein
MKTLDTRWRGVPVLAACCGLSYYLVTADWVTGLAIAAGVACLVALLVVLRPPSRRWRRAEDFYVVAAMLLVLPWVMVKVGYPGKHGDIRYGWHDLHARYAATGYPPRDLQDGRDIVVRKLRFLYAPRTDSYRRVATSFGDQEVYLSQTFPLSLLYSPVEIPLASIWRCRNDSEAPATTTLSIRDVEMEIAVPDEAGRILAWCARHEIPEDEPPRTTSAP